MHLPHNGHWAEAREGWNRIQEGASGAIRISLYYLVTLAVGARAVCDTVGRRRTWVKAGAQNDKLRDQQS